MIKRVLLEGTLQRADDGVNSVCKSLRNGFVRCVDERHIGCLIVGDVFSRYRERILALMMQYLNELSIAGGISG